MGFPKGVTTSPLVKGGVETPPAKWLRSLDCAGRTELAANEFRITQTEDKILRDQINTERNAIDTHQRVGEEVRTTIKKLGGTMPEDLPAETSIKKLVNRKRKLTLLPDKDSPKK